MRSALGQRDGKGGFSGVHDARSAEREISRTLESKPEAATHWSTRGPAEVTGLSQSAIVRI